LGRSLLTLIAAARAWSKDHLPALLDRAAQEPLMYASSTPTTSDNCSPSTATGPYVRAQSPASRTGNEITVREITHLADNHLTALPGGLRALPRILNPSPKEHGEQLP
jgi:hypothetical protein